MSWWLALARWLHLLPLLTLFGAATFIGLLRYSRVIADRIVLPWAVGAAWLALLAAVAHLLLTVDAMTGAMPNATTIREVFVQTQFGHLAILRLSALAALLGAVTLYRPGAVGTAIFSGIALVALAFTSHAAAGGDASHAGWRAANDAIHLLTAGFWLGGLAVILELASRKQATPAPLLPTLRLFSEVAIYAVTALTLAGMLNTVFVFAAERVGWTYTLVLALKVALALAMIVLAFINRLRVMPALEAQGDDPRLAANVLSEFRIGAVVVALAAILGSISPG